MDTTGWTYELCTVPAAEPHVFYFCPTSGLEVFCPEPGVVQVPTHVKESVLADLGQRFAQRPEPVQGPEPAKLAEQGSE